MKIIGIDLGTTNTCVAVYEKGRARIIDSAEGAPVIPSVFGEKDSGEEMVGVNAARTASVNADHTYASVKRIIGRPFEDEVVKRHLNDASYSIARGKGGALEIVGRHGRLAPTDVSAAILGYVKTLAERSLRQPIEKAVVTVPAYFNDAQRKATREAGRLAGLDVVRIVNEPTAAAIGYALDQLEPGAEKKTIAVYDLGGGTFDISILEVTNDSLTALASNGDTFLGGDDLDARIVNWMADGFLSEKGRDLRSNNMALQRLREKAEDAKKELSSLQYADINIPYLETDDRRNPLHLNMRLTRETLEEMAGDLIERTLEPCRVALSDAGLTVEQIDEVVLVGGMTRMPAVQEAVKAFFGKEASQGADPEKIVAMGAALYGAIIAEEIEGVEINDITPFALGVESTDERFIEMIPAQSALPVSRRLKFTTAEDNQPVVTVRALQGRSDKARECSMLGQCHLEGLPSRRAGELEIDVMMSINEDGVVAVTAVDMHGGNQQRLEARLW